MSISSKDFFIWIRSLFKKKEGELTIGNADTQSKPIYSTIGIVSGGIIKSRVDFFASTHIGRCRENNEDNFYPQNVADAVSGIFIVADGMGGLHGGEIASATACEVLSGKLHKADHGEMAIEEQMNAAFKSATEAIHKLGDGDQQHIDSGTTAVVAFMNDNSLHIGNLGDSRAYLMRSGKLSLLSHDHSLLSLLIERGEISPGEARSHPARNQLTRYIGMDVDLPIFYTEYEWYPGDRVLLCSDGLWDMIDNELLQKLLSLDSGIEAITEMIGVANEAGGPDNITALLIWNKLS